MRPKIIVVQLKEVIRTAAFAIIGLILIILLIYFFIPKDNSPAAIYTPGTYSSEIILHSNPVLVSVTVSGDEIEMIELLNMQASQGSFYPLFEPTLDELAKEIIETQSLEVSASTDTAVTSSILLEAVSNALSKAEL